jgi:hypothetical protein
LTFALTVALFIPTSFAQKNDEARTRALFVNKKSDAMMVLLLKQEGNQLVPADPASEFKEGDQIKIQFESNFEGFVYLVNIQPNGKKKILFPYDLASGNSIVANRRYDFPPGRDLIQFDNEKGTEILQVIMSRDRIALLDDAIKNSNGELGESAASAAAELEGGISTEKTTDVVPEGGENGVRSRNITIAQGRDKNPQGSVVAIEDKPASGKTPAAGEVNTGRLKKGEIAKFELRLKHQ